MVITLLREVINMVTEDPKNAVSQCLSYVSTPSSSPQTVRKSRPAFDSDAAKVITAILVVIYLFFLTFNLDVCSSVAI